MSDGSSSQPGGASNTRTLTHKQRRPAAPSKITGGACVVCCPKKRARIIMSRLLSLFTFVFALPCLASAKPSVLRAGAAAMDITPKEFPMNMPGGFSPNPATSAHDPFHARALVLDDG